MWSICRFKIIGTPSDKGPNFEYSKRRRFFNVEGKYFFTEDASYEIARTLHYYSKIYDDPRSMDFEIEIFVDEESILFIRVHESSEMIFYLHNIPVYLKNYNPSEIIENINPEEFGIEFRSVDKEDWDIYVHSNEIARSKYLQNIASFNNDVNNGKWDPFELTIYKDRMSITFQSINVMNNIDEINSSIKDIIKISIGFKNDTNYHLMSTKEMIPIDIKTLITEIAKAKKQNKFKDYKSKVISGIDTVFLKTIRFSTIELDPQWDKAIVYLPSNRTLNDMPGKPILLKEFILDSKDTLIEFIKYLFSLGAVLPGDEFSAKRLNSLILVYHISLDDGVYLEDIEERKKIIRSYHYILNKEERELLRQGFLSEEMIELSDFHIHNNQLEIESFNLTETFAGKFVYDGNQLVFKNNDLQETIEVPDLKNVIDLYEFEYKVLLNQRGITLSPFMRRKIIFDICLKYSLEPLIFLQEYFAILKVKANSSDHKKLLDLFEEKNREFIKKKIHEDPIDTYQDEQDFIRRSYNEYYGYEGSGWYEEE